MKLIIFILIVLIIAALLIRIILRSVNQHSPLLMQLHAAGIRTGDAERILSSGEYWQRQKTLLTEREVSFMKGLFRIVDMKRWYLCPQVRVADIVQLNENTLGMDELIAKAWRFVRERFRSYQTELKSRGIKRARARRDANRERQDIVTLVKRQLTREIAEGRFTANREAVKREVERRVKERMILSRNRNYSRLATASP
ncbi:hypothetical protein [Escherichia coli]|uniref:hypothetical protein n=1 Tax=Escherichia coli TaxID=562 RepID=UPI0035300C9E